MPFIVGTVSQYDDPISILDPAVAVAAKFIKMPATRCALWNAMPSPMSGITSDEFEIYSRSSTDRKGALRGTGWDASATTGLAISDALANVVTVGTVLEVAGERVIVKAVSRSTGASTIDVRARGYAGTTAAAHAASVVANVVGFAGTDSSLSKVESFSELTNKFTNYSQTVFRKISRTYTETITGRKGVDNPQALREQEEMQVIAELCGAASVTGLKYKGLSADDPNTTAGVLQQLSDDAGGTRKVNRADFAAGTFNEDNFRAVLNKAFDSGAPDTILMSRKKKDLFNDFKKGIIWSDRNDKTASRDIEAYEYEGNKLTALVDYDMPDDRVAIITLGKCQKGWKQGDILRKTQEPAESSRLQNDAFQGTFGIIVEGVGYDHLDIYNVG